MAENAVEIFNQAETALKNGEYQQALSEYLRVVQTVPHFFRARFRIADTLLNLGVKEKALTLYQGLFLQGASCNIILYPETRFH